MPFDGSLPDDEPPPRDDPPPTPATLRESVLWMIRFAGVLMLLWGVGVWLGRGHWG